MTNKKQRRGSDRKSSILGDIVATPIPSTVSVNRKQARRFLEQYFSDVPIEDLEGRSPEIMAGIGLSHLEFGARRRKGEAMLRIYNPTEASHGYVSPYTFVEMVNDDMPFLVDSVTAALNRHDLAAQITVHPIIRIHRDKQGQIETVCKPDDHSGHPESFIRFAVDRETDPQQLSLIKQEIHKVLADVRVAVRDWRKMRERMLECVDLLEVGPPGVDEELRSESQALLEWLANDHFTFLGYREYELEQRGKKTVLRPVKDTGLGLLSGPDHEDHTTELTADMRRLTRSKDWLILTKANSKSTVHRNTYLDYIGVKVYDKDGTVLGERRFIGLFTSIAYSENPNNIPLLRHKIDRVLERANIDPTAHRGKALMHIIDTFPRDELFHASIQDLTRTTVGILNLQDRQRVKFFLRRDTFRRFYSCLVYVPREKYTTAVRERIEEILKEELDGRSIDSAVQISDSALARVHIVIHTDDGDRPRISMQRIEERLAEVVITWADRLRAEIMRTYGPDDGPAMFRAYRDVFPLGYQADVEPADACSDIHQIEAMIANGDRQSVDLYKPEDSLPGHMHFIVYTYGGPIALSDSLPLLEDMGVDVYTEHPYELTLKGGESLWIQDYHLRHESGADLDFDAVEVAFEECFAAVVDGRAENDGLHRLILSAGLNWRQTAMLRCYTKHLLQLGVPFSQDYMEDVLVSHAGFTRRLVRLFELQFDPGIPKSRRKRELEALLPALKRSVAKAGNVDEDRIMSAFFSSVYATLRTNYFLRGPEGEFRPCISIKLDPSGMREVRLPRPKYEIFVYSPEVEGVHLRAGDIARGGLRWSDRREDFRTEILGLMKAQVVKNTVIVPTGAKGGFFPKRVPDGGRDKILENGIACYKTFISGLLDITDNVVNGEVVTPPGVIRRDGDDPYLVVAADKGTATFLSLIHI